MDLTITQLVDSSCEGTGCGRQLSSRFQWNTQWVRWTPEREPSNRSDTSADVYMAWLTRLHRCVCAEKGATGAPEHPTFTTHGSQARLKSTSMLEHGITLNRRGDCRLCDSPRPGEATTDLGRCMPLDTTTTSETSRSRVRATSLHNTLQRTSLSSSGGCLANITAERTQAHAATTSHTCGAVQPQGRSNGPSRIGDEDRITHLVDGDACLVVVDARQHQVHPAGPRAPTPRHGRVADAGLERIVAPQRCNVEVVALQLHVWVDLGEGLDRSIGLGQPAVLRPATCSGWGFWWRAASAIDHTLALKVIHEIIQTC